MLRQRYVSRVLDKILPEREHPRAAARIGVEACELGLALCVGQFRKILEVVLADRMRFYEGVGIDESAQDELQFADYGRRLERVTGFCVASDVGEKDLFAGGEQ